MSERKVLNKYYPPDFDPIKLIQQSRKVKKQEGTKKKKGPKQMNVRFMMPFTMCCGSCHEFCYVGTKFNSRIEKVVGIDYLGIPIWRFYGRCPSCCSEFAFKTDPENTAYVLEFGGTRTYDPHRDASLAATAKDEFRKEMEGDAMKTLEHKTYTTANELLDLEQLDELRKMNKRLLHQTAMTEEALVKLISDKDDKATFNEESERREEEELQEFRRDRKRLREEPYRGGVEKSSDDSSEGQEDGARRCTTEGGEVVCSAGNNINESVVSGIRDTLSVIPATDDRSKNQAPEGNDKSTGSGMVGSIVPNLRVKKRKEDVGASNGLSGLFGGVYGDDDA